MVQSYGHEIPRLHYTEIVYENLVPDTIAFWAPSPGERAWTGPHRLPRPMQGSTWRASGQELVYLAATADDSCHPHLHLVRRGPPGFELGGGDPLIGTGVRRRARLLAMGECPRQLLRLRLRHGDLGTLPDQLELETFMFFHQLVVEPAKPAGEQADLVGGGLVLAPARARPAGTGPSTADGVGSRLELGLELTERGAFAGPVGEGRLRSANCPRQARVDSGRVETALIGRERLQLDLRIRPSVRGGHSRRRQDISRSWSIGPRHGLILLERASLRIRTLRLMPGGHAAGPHREEFRVRDGHVDRR